MINTFNKTILILAGLSLAFVPVYAKGPFSKVMIYAEGLAFESSDSALMDFGSFNRFETTYPGTPSVTGAGYLIVRLGLEQETGEYVAFDSLRFFSTSLGEGGKAYVYYEGLVNGWSEYDGRWYEAEPEAAEKLNQLITLEKQKVALIKWGWLAAGLVGLGIGILSRKRIKQK